MKNIIMDHIIDKYEPHTVILYGSYADGSNNENSDFDALVITDKDLNFHDGSIVNGVQLDIFIYNTSFKDNINYEDYVQIHDGEIIIDKNGVGKDLQDKVCELIKNTTKKSKEEKEHQLEWCEKMLLRSKRDNIEGYFRWHWLLVDSLEIYFILCDEYYYGPKKSLLKLEKTNKDAFDSYSKALRNIDSKSLEDWVEYLKYTFKDKL
ncbi:nucleotidyltransferase domain-containing protein [Clostridium chrysemydis]|uniref:nucleotidyltransferase domain-containing protein n=1 Tax=Clostridium chrysemydis TaxID=2665504 RepID=UPI00188360BE|nr:nucleotidyltransferase domain-containing protein [Clostridium chrysemydis]